VLHLKVTAPPVDSAANDAVIEFFSKALKLPKRDIEIVSGATSRNKRVRVAGLTLDDIRLKLANS
jgi:uncharacterized protein (TIGR00251 family)